MMVEKQEQCVCFNEGKVVGLQELYGGIDYKVWANIFKAVGHERRLQVLYLIGKGDLCVCDLAQTMEVPVSTVSQYLRILKQAGLIYDHQVHKFLYYKLTDLGKKLIGDMEDE